MTSLPSVPTAIKKLRKKIDWGYTNIFNELIFLSKLTSSTLKTLKLLIAALGPNQQSSIYLSVCLSIHPFIRNPKPSLRTSTQAFRDRAVCSFPPFPAYLWNAALSYFSIAQFSPINRHIRLGELGWEYEGSVSVVDTHHCPPPCPALPLFFQIFEHWQI